MGKDIAKKFEGKWIQEKAENMDFEGSAIEFERQLDKEWDEDLELIEKMRDVQRKNPSYWTEMTKTAEKESDFEETVATKGFVEKGGITMLDKDWLQIIHKNTISTKIYYNKKFRLSLNPNSAHFPKIK